MTLLTRDLGSYLILCCVSHKPLIGKSYKAGCCTVAHIVGDDLHPAILPDTNAAVLQKIKRSSVNTSRMKRYALITVWGCEYYTISTSRGVVNVREQQLALFPLSNVKIWNFILCLPWVAFSTLRDKAEKHTIRALQCDHRLSQHSLKGIQYVLKELISRNKADEAARKSGGQQVDLASVLRKHERSTRYTRSTCVWKWKEQQEGPESQGGHLHKAAKHKNTMNTIEQPSKQTNKQRHICWQMSWGITHMVQKTWTKVFVDPSRSSA